jgi:hypothetical protein
MKVVFEKIGVGFVSKTMERLGKYLKIIQLFKNDPCPWELFDNIRCFHYMHTHTY